MNNSQQTVLGPNLETSENRPLMSNLVPPNKNSLAEMEDFSEIDRRSLDDAGDRDVMVELSSRISEDGAVPITNNSENGNLTPGKDETDMRNLNGDMRSFPYAPGHYPHDHNNQDGFVLATDLESIPDVNVYQHKKTLAQGMMDLALFSANANQLRYVLESSMHPYFYPNIIMISLSLILQIAIGVGLIMNSRYNVKDQKEICIANKINNYTVVGIFIVTSINVFISAFGVAPTPLVPIVTAVPASPPLIAPAN